MGASMNQFLTDLCKFSIGRLRPHFFEVCQPNVTCTDANKYDYIENFECLRTSHPLISDQKFARALDEVRFVFDANVTFRGWNQTFSGRGLQEINAGLAILYFTSIDVLTRLTKNSMRV